MKEKGIRRRYIGMEYEIIKMRYETMSKKEKIKVRNLNQKRRENDKNVKFNQEVLIARGD